MDTQNNETANLPPDMSGQGNDFLDTIQILQNKEIHEGYFQAELPLRFGSAFQYPVYFKFQGIGAVPETVALAFDVSQKDKTKQLVEEKLIVPKVCASVTRNQITDYLTDIVEKDDHFTIYLNRKPLACEKLRFYQLSGNQKIVFNEHLVMAIIKILDDRKKNKQRDT